ncbi:unnamed protein product, partial [Mesorhabditis belari]|uniref:Glycoprotein hormone subunit beta domain-containing protein n=1 Tax=Mesorhabditis belari TaxID=2138241 RepID=A0AAF3EX16_9BILA
MELGVRPFPWRPHFFELFIVLLCTFSLSFRLAQSASTRETCRLIGEEKLIDIEGCPLQVVRVNACAGYCHSHTLFNPIDGNFLRRSQCCRMVDKDYVTKTLNCESGERVVRIPTAIQCSCMECAPSTERRR